MDRKIIFFDIDGTIFCIKHGRITDNVKQSIARAQKRGHLCMIASGRPYSFIANNVKELGFDGYVLANGAHIKYQGRDMGIQYLNYEDARDMCRRFRQGNIQYVLSTPTYSYIDGSFTKLLDFFRRCNIDFENFVYDFDEDEILKKTLKIEAWADTQEDVDYAERYCGKFTSEIHGPGQTIEICGKNVTKATGIRQVMEILHLPVDSSFCFGDGPNDVEMFETVGHGFAMENGVDAVKTIAEGICPSVEEDGVAVKLRELFEAGVL